VRIIIKNIFYAGALLLLVAMPAEAYLIDRGNGMIYDDVLDMTWLQDTNYAFSSGYNTVNDGRMTHSDATVWADQLVYGGFDDWTLPGLGPDPDNSVRSFDGSTEWGYNNTNLDSPMSYMYYLNLGLTGSRDLAGNDVACYGLYPDLELCDPLPDPAGFANGGDELDIVSFLNLSPWYYWYDEPYVKEGHEGKHWTMKFDSGVQGSPPANPGDAATSYAWAVRAGDVAVVPVPAAVWLFISGLAGLAGVARRKNQV
jgi:hypothetical protein